MRPTIFYLFIAALTALFAGCDKTDITAYYYPLDTQVHTYEYASNDSMPPYRLLLQKHGNYLTTNRFDMTTDALEQVVKEEIVDNGTLCTEYALMFKNDKNGKDTLVRAQINEKANTFFPFSVHQNGGVFPFEISWTNPFAPHEKMTVTRNRFFNGIVQHEWQGKTHACAEFVVKSRYRSDDAVAGTIAPETITTERYAKDIGLIYTRTDLGGQVVTYTLRNRK